MGCVYPLTWRQNETIEASLVFKPLEFEGFKTGVVQPLLSYFWKQHDVLERQGEQRAFNHPRRGLVTYRQVTLRPVEQEHLKLVVLSPA